MKESDIRPKDLHDEYIRLSSIDSLEYFPVNKKRFPIDCPACLSNNLEHSFKKEGFDYEACKDCGTLFASPRPPLEDFVKFYEDSPSSSYWAKVFFPTVADARRKSMFAPKVKEISELFKKKDFKIETIIDVGAGHGIFLEEWQKVNQESKIFAVEPGKELANICRSKGIETLEKIVEEADEYSNKGDLVTSFEVIEHCTNPIEYIQSLKNITKDGGYVVISGVSIDGFDIQILGKESKTIAPPYHINFISVEGFYALFKLAGFSEVEVITPGKLDLDIVLNNLQEDKLQSSGLNFLNIINKRGQSTKDLFQQFLRDANMSSHIWVIAKK